MCQQLAKCFLFPLESPESLSGGHKIPDCFSWSHYKHCLMSLGQQFTNKLPPRCFHGYRLLISSGLSLEVLTVFLWCKSKTCTQGKI